MAVTIQMIYDDTEKGSNTLRNNKLSWFWCYSIITPYSNSSRDCFWIAMSTYVNHYSALWTLHNPWMCLSCFRDTNFRYSASHSSLCYSQMLTHCMPQMNISSFKIMYWYVQWCVYLKCRRSVLQTRCAFQKKRSYSMCLVVWCRCRVVNRSI